jgi:hypothetical protein
VNIWRHAVSFPHVTTLCHKGRSSYIIMKYLVPPPPIPFRINTNLPCYTKTYATTQCQLSVQHIYSSVPVTQFKCCLQRIICYENVHQNLLKPTLHLVNRSRKLISESVTDLRCNMSTGYQSVSRNALPTYLATC